MKLRGCNRLACPARHVVVALSIATIVLMAAAPCWAQDQDTEDIEDILQLEKRSGRQQLCGGQLVDALHILCQGNYNGLPSSKLKKNYGSPDNDFTRHRESDADYGMLDVLQGLQGFRGQPGADWLPRQSRFPFRERLAASAFLPGALRRQIRGVHDECCAKSCTINELRSYCNDNSAA